MEGETTPAAWLELLAGGVVGAPISGAVHSRVAPAGGVWTVELVAYESLDERTAERVVASAEVPAPGPGTFGFSVPTADGGPDINVERFSVRHAMRAFDRSENRPSPVGIELRSASRPEPVAEAVEAGLAERLHRDHQRVERAHDAPRWVSVVLGAVFCVGAAVAAVLAVAVGAGDGGWIERSVAAVVFLGVAAAAGMWSTSTYRRLRGRPVHGVGLTVPRVVRLGASVEVEVAVDSTESVAVGVVSELWFVETRLNVALRRRIEPREHLLAASFREVPPGRHRVSLELPLGIPTVHGRLAQVVHLVRAVPAVDVERARSAPRPPTRSDAVLVVVA